MSILPRRIGAAVQPDRRGRVSLGVRVVALILGFAVASGCTVAITPEQAAEGALRARLSADVAPDGYRSGVLPPELAEAWRSRAATVLEPWFGDGLRQAHVGWIDTVTGNLKERPGPIVTSIDVRDNEIPPATIEGDSARINGASIGYTKHFAPGSWNEIRVEGGMMCLFELRRVDARWVVEEETCNLSM